MVKCSFCKNVVEPGTGFMLIRNNGDILHFCSLKCDKNTFKLGHNPRRTKWSKAFEKGGVQK